ncbi:hypothetical protein BVG19_g5427 [[Candida] boidinii]|nr:hypothetical protein BVG19_g5427 [[Candida] boidinii]OWB51688.1 hypothetical protein B5S27_g3254 [[Candida] boidinii]
MADKNKKPQCQKPYIAVWDDKYQEWFYVNEDTGKSQWEAPPGTVLGTSSPVPPPPYDQQGSDSSLELPSNGKSAANPIPNARPNQSQQRGNYGQQQPYQQQPYGGYPPQQQYGQPPYGGYPPQQPYGGYPPQQPYGYASQPQYYQQPPQQQQQYRRGGGGMGGMGGMMAGAAVGTLGGVMLGSALANDNETNVENNYYGDDGGDYGGGGDDFGGGDF